MSAQNGREADETSNETLNDAVAKVNKQEGDFFDRTLTRKKILCVLMKYFHKKLFAIFNRLAQKTYT